MSVGLFARFLKSDREMVEYVSRSKRLDSDPDHDPGTSY